MQATCNFAMPQLVVDNWVQIFSDLRPQEALMLSLVSKAFESVTHQSRVWKIFVNTYKYDPHEYEELCQIKMGSFNNQSKIAFFQLKKKRIKFNVFCLFQKLGWMERIFNKEEMDHYVPGKDLVRFISEEGMENSDFYKALKEKASVLTFNKLEEDAHEGEPPSLEKSFLTELVDFEVFVSAIESLGVTFFKLKKADEIVLPFYRDFLFGYAITQVADEREQQIQAFLPKLTRLLETFQVMQCQTFCSIFLGNSHESAEGLQEDNVSPRFLCLAPLTIIESLLSHFKQGRLKFVDHHLQPLSFSILMAEIFVCLKEFEKVENCYPFHKLKTPYEEIRALFNKYQVPMKDKG